MSSNELARHHLTTSAFDIPVIKTKMKCSCPTGMKILYINDLLGKGTVTSTAAICPLHKNHMENRRWKRRESTKSSLNHNGGSWILSLLLQMCILVTSSLTVKNI